MKLKWVDIARNLWQARECGSVLLVMCAPTNGKFVAQAVFCGTKIVKSGFATMDEAKAAAERMLARMVRAMEGRIKRIKEQLA